MLTVSRPVVMCSCFSFSFRSISVSRRPLTTFSSAANVLQFSHPRDGVLGTGLFCRNNLMLVKLLKEEEEADGSAADGDMNPLAGRFGVPQVEEEPDGSAADRSDGSAAEGSDGSAAEGSDGCDEWPSISLLIPSSTAASSTSSICEIIGGWGLDALSKASSLAMYRCFAFFIYRVTISL
ncbi:hypothetical protein DPEC_G00361120 [Dallia pectoralis]|uniref:Uncharacterized protein n=1 Tax=Dallia pectoralis TaxID=75939 RepID=A0ACC2F1E7_DALPE|nr:hypothetical protein DPEC_G00361120 [Dallia pectoralis]